MASGILVVVEHEGGQPKKTAYELLTKACQLVGEVGGAVSAVVIGSDYPADLGNYGASTVYTVSGAGFEAFTSVAWTAGGWGLLLLFSVMLHVPSPVPRAYTSLP